MNEKLGGNLDMLKILSCECTDFCKDFARNYQNGLSFQFSYSIYWCTKYTGHSVLAILAFPLIALAKKLKA